MFAGRMGGMGAFGAGMPGQGFGGMGGQMGGGMPVRGMPSQYGKSPMMGGQTRFNGNL